MKYFILQTDPQMNEAPNIINWFGAIDKRNICRSQSYKLSMRQILYIAPQKSLFFTDIITSPLFLVTNMVKKVVEMYDAKTVYKQIILLDRKHKQSCVYYLPILEHVMCLSPESIVSKDKSTIIQPVLLKSAVEDKSIFFVGDVSNTYVIARLDFVESILRRDACGISLISTELEV